MVHVENEHQNQASSRSRIRCTNKQTERFTSASEDFSTFFPNSRPFSKEPCLGTTWDSSLYGQVWAQPQSYLLREFGLVQSQGVTLTPTATWLSYFAKEQSSRNVNPSNCFFCFAASLTTDQQTYDGQEGLPESFLLSFILSENRAIGHK